MLDASTAELDLRTQLASAIHERDTARALSQVRS